MSRIEPVLFRVNGTNTSVGSSEETTLQLPSDKAEVWLLVSFHYVRSGGTASNYAPLLGQSATWSAGGIDERLTYASTAVGTAINDVFATPVPLKCDANGRVYFRPGFVGVSTDNSGAYEFWFQKARGG